MENNESKQSNKITDHSLTQTIIFQLNSSANLNLSAAVVSQANGYRRQENAININKFSVKPR